MPYIAVRVLSSYTLSFVSTVAAKSFHHNNNLVNDQKSNDIWISYLDIISHVGF